MTLSKLTVPALAVAMVASILTIGIMLLSPVMAASPFGEGTCGSLGGLILRGGETRNNGGDITAEQYDARIDDCRSATLRQSGLLALPIAAGGLAWWGAMTVKGRRAE